MVLMNLYMVDPMLIDLISLPVQYRTIMQFGGLYGYFLAISKLVKAAICLVSE